MTNCGSTGRDMGEIRGCHRTDFVLNVGIAEHGRYPGFKIGPAMCCPRLRIAHFVGSWRIRRTLVDRVPEAERSHVIGVPGQAVGPGSRGRISGGDVRFDGRHQSFDGGGAFAAALDLRQQSARRRRRRIWCSNGHTPALVSSSPGSWSHVDLPPYWASPMLTTLTGGSGAGEGTWTCSSNAPFPMGQLGPCCAAVCDTHRCCSATNQPRSAGHRVVSVDRVLTAGTCLVKGAGSHSLCMQRASPPVPDQLQSRCAIWDIARPGACQTCDRVGEHCAVGTGRRALVRRRHVHPLAPDCSRLDPGNSESVQVKQT